MKSENIITHKKVWLKIHEIINNQMKNEFLYIWTWIIIWNKSSFNISHQSVTTFERQSDWQTSIIITTYNYWKWRKSVFCWLDWWHEMKYKVHMIWISDQIRRIWIKNMKIIHNNKKKHICFNKKFHQNYSSWFASIKWVKNENW